MSELFRRSGYRTSLIGKISHTPDGLVYNYDGSGSGQLEVPHAWDDLLTPLGSWRRGWGIFFAYADGKHREDGGGHRDLMQFTVERDEDLPDGLMAEAAVAQLQELSRSDAPFFLGLGFFKPHLPFAAPRADWQAFQNSDIPLPRNERIDSPYWHRSGEFYKYEMPFAKTWPLSDDAMRSSKRAYLACVRYVDRQVGKVVRSLDRLGLADDTIVVVWGDHGWHLGEQQLWGKHTPFERATRSVLLMRVPGMRSQLVGAAMRSVESLDLYPTLIELCRPQFTKTEFPLDGQDLTPIFQDPGSTVRDYATSYWRDAVSVRSPTHRLIATVDASGHTTRTALYDLSDDLDSSVDVAERQSHIRSELLRQLPGD